MNNLLKNIHYSKFSYISECSIIKTENKKNIIIQKEKNTNIHDRFYYEKILISIDKTKIVKSVFSELENY